ncbi:MAG TPA: dephospho-CoA kinase [Candidatus Aquicultor sp.]|jgi:dephospho-CoA kinase
MKIIGVTGSIGSGKSTVAALLRDKGALLIDADNIAREVVERGQPAFSEIVERFGEDIVDKSGAIKRRQLGKIVFEDPQKREALNKIVHPAVMTEIDRRLQRMEAEYGDDQVVVLDVPLLIEVGYHARCVLVVIVTATRHIRCERLLQKGLSKEEAEARIEAQGNKEALQHEADVIIENNGSLETLKTAVDALWRRITSTHCE